MIEIYAKILRTHIGCVLETLTNFVSCYGNVFIHTSTWMAQEDSMKSRYPQRRNSTVT